MLNMVKQVTKVQENVKPLLDLYQMVEILEYMMESYINGTRAT